MRRVWVILAVAVPLMLSAGGSANAAFPGGNGLIAFVKGGDIWVMTANGTSQHRIAVNGVEPTWSPNGKRIAFTRNADIWVMKANGTAQTRITTSTAHDFEPAWSQDGNWILFASNRGHPATNDYGIFKLHPSRPFGSVVAVVPKIDFEDALAPAVAATGRLAYLLDEDDADSGNCCSIEVRTGSTDTSIGFAFGNRGLDWGPAATTLAFGVLTPDPMDPDGNVIGGKIETIRSDGTHLRVLNRPGGTRNYYDENPSWAPAGTYLVFDELHGLSGAGSIWKMKGDGSGRVQLSTTGTDPSWQPVP